jgi:hypothetical protein
VVSSSELAAARLVLTSVVATFVVVVQADPIF